MDIAQLGFKVDTSDLDKANTKLDAFKAAANGVSTSATATAAAIEGANAKVLSSNLSMAAANKAAADAALLRLKASQGASEADVAAATALQAKTKLALADAAAAQKQAKAIMDATAAQRAMTAVTKVAFAKSTSIVGATKTAGPTMAVNNGPSTSSGSEPNRFNTANVAAQFHDVAVTAAMGMNPLTIALQQGTQLSAVLNSMKDPLKGIAAAFGEVFNVISLGTIAVIALVAAGLEMVNWSKVALISLNALAGVVQYLGPLFIGLGVAFAAIKWQTIQAGVMSAYASLALLGPAFTAIGTAAAAAWAFILTPIGLIAAGIAAVTAAVLYMTGWFTQASAAIKKWADDMLGAGKYAKQFREDVAGQIDDLLIQQKTIGMSATAAANYAAKQNLVNKAIEDWTANNKGATLDAFHTALDKITAAAEAAVSPLEALAAQRDKLQDDKNLGDFNKDIDERIARLRLEASTLDMSREAANRYLTAFDLIAEAKGKTANGNIGQDEVNALQAKAAQIAALQEQIDKKNDKDPWEGVQKDAQKRLNTAQAEQASIGQTAGQTALLKVQTELLNDALQKKVDLDTIDVSTGKSKREMLMQTAQAIATVQESTRQMKAALDFVESTSQGFFDDMKTNLQNGEGLWKSFGNAVTNVLSKILDAIVNSGIKNIVSNLFDTTPGSTGILGTIGKTLFSAKGNAFDGGGVTAFAKGGSFTNSIVNKATPFAFAKGGALGVMGEAGPEAVMPLHRGPDGSLGVRSAGGSGGDQNVQVNVINNNNSAVTTQTRQNSSGGMQIDLMIDQVTSDKISDMSSSTNKALMARDSRSMIRR